MQRKDMVRKIIRKALEDMEFDFALAGLPDRTDSLWINYVSVGCTLASMVIKTADGDLYQFRDLSPFQLPKKASSFEPPLHHGFKERKPSFIEVSDLLQTAVDFYHVSLFSPLGLAGGKIDEHTLLLYSSGSEMSVIETLIAHGTTVGFIVPVQISRGSWQSIRSVLLLPRASTDSVMNAIYEVESPETLVKRLTNHFKDLYIIQQRGTPKRVDLSLASTAYSNTRRFVYR